MTAIVPAVVDRLDAPDRSGAKEIDHGVPVVRRRVRELEGNPLNPRLLAINKLGAAQFAGRPLIENLKRRVEPADAVKPSSQGDPAAKATSAMGIVVSTISCFAKWARRV